MTVSIRPSIDRPAMWVVVCDHCGVLHAYPMDLDDAIARKARHECSGTKVGALVS